MAGEMTVFGTGPYITDAVTNSEIFREGSYNKNGIIQKTIELAVKYFADKVLDVMQLETNKNAFFRETGRFFMSKLDTPVAITLHMSLENTLFPTFIVTSKREADEPSCMSEKETEELRVLFDEASEECLGQEIATIVGDEEKADTSSSSWGWPCAIL